MDGRHTKPACPLDPFIIGGPSSTDQSKFFIFLDVMMIGIGKKSSVSSLIAASERVLSLASFVCFSSERPPQTTRES